MIYKWPYTRELFYDSFADDVFPPNFLKNQITQQNGLFVEFPDAMRFHLCIQNHGYPSGILTRNHKLQLLDRLEGCPNCTHSVVDWYHRENMSTMSPLRDLLNRNCSFLHQQFNNMEELLQHHTSVDISTLKLVRLEETRRDGEVRIGEGIEKLKVTFPREVIKKIFPNCKAYFNEILRSIYSRNIGFIKGKFLVISPELLLRSYNGNIESCLKIIGQAYALVQCYYCGIERLAVEGGFWQVSPEMGGFFWRNTDLETQYSFLRKFIRNATKKEGIIVVRNFSLSMGPHFIVGGGRFGVIVNHLQEYVFWFIPNLWHCSIRSFAESQKYGNVSFWYGWIYNKSVRYGSSYYGISNRECSSEMLKKITFVTKEYYQSDD